MSDPTNAQRAMMAAHLCDLAAKALRSGRRSHLAPSLMFVAGDVLHVVDPVQDYREALRDSGVSPADIDAAVAAIARGEHPADSLPGQLMRYHGKAKREAESVPGSFREHHCEGEVKALGHVLDLLGYKVTP
jgi:hypothetical protein